MVQSEERFDTNTKVLLPPNDRVHEDNGEGGPAGTASGSDGERGKAGTSGGTGKTWGPLVGYVQPYQEAYVWDGAN